MTDRYEIRPAGPLEAIVRPPGSKSLTNRALLCAALAQGPSLLRDALDSEDTRVMCEALRRLGVEVRAQGDDLSVVGCGGRFPAAQAQLDVANSGTTMRFLTAALAAAAGRYRLDGTPRMRQRPIGPMLQALRRLGGQVSSLGDDQCPPVSIEPGPLAGGSATIRGDLSSQFLSGLLMAAPTAQGDVELKVVGPLVSRPYVDMTIAVMRKFGVRVAEPSSNRFHVPAGQSYAGRELRIEPDASAASYFWGAAAVAGGSVKVLGLGRDSLQGDVAFCDCLERMGCRVRWESDGVTVGGGPLRGVAIDMGGISDTAQTLAVVALFAEGPTTIRGVGHIRHKETDRIGDLARELRKLGAHVDELDDGLRIVPGPLGPAEIDTYNDHRMAMSFALAGLRQKGVVILDPGCTEKTYPRFFEDFERVSGG